MIWVGYCRGLFGISCLLILADLLSLVVLVISHCVYDATLLLAVEAEFALCDFACWHYTDTQGSIYQSSFNFQAFY